MAQTNYNMFVKLVFDREVLSTDMDNLWRAFSMVINQRDSYHQPLYSKTLDAVGANYAVDSQGAVAKNTIIVKFSPENNFRKAEGPVKLIFNNAAGNIYGPKPKDALASFEQEFTPVNIDMYQNPDTADTIRITENLVGSYILKAVTVVKHSPTADSIKIVESITDVIIKPVLIGTINP